MWQNLLSRLSKTSKRNKKNRKKRSLRMETMEKRQLMAVDIGVISGVAFIDQNNDGLPAGDPAIVLQGPPSANPADLNNGTLVAPGTAGARGLQIQLFNDSNTNGVFDAGSDSLAGTIFSSTVDGSYRFDSLAAGDFFVIQESVPGLSTPTPTLVTITNGSVQTELIDDFSATGQTATANAGATITDSQNAATETIGGARDIQAVNTAGTGQVTVFIDSAADQLSIGSLGDGTGTGLVQYDGPDGAITLSPTGLGGVSLAGGAPGATIDPDAGLVIETRAENAGDNVTITIHTDGANSSSAIVPIPQDATNFTETFVPFSTFVVASGTGADFNDVGAIESLVSLSPNNDVFVQIVEAVEPEVVVTNLASIQTISLGGQVFLDDSASGLNNGNREVVEGGVTGVTVQLFQLVGANDVVDPAIQVALASTTSGVNGTYTFDNLEPGNYAIVIGADQFIANAPLFGFINSTGNDPASDPDDNADDDDNGTTLPSGDVISGTITLESNIEPTNDDDTDPNTNTTIDFGFVPQVDLDIDKSVNTASSNLAPGGNVVFDFVVNNSGPLEATNVTVEDIFPAGLVFTGLVSPPGSSFSQSTLGTTVTVSLGDIPAGGQATFQLTANIIAGQTADITNSATVETAEQVDTNPANDTDDAVVDITSADLSIVKTDLADPVNAGEQITYQIVVTNNGPDSADGVQVVDTLPIGATFVSGDVDGAANLVTIDAGTGDIIADVGTLANGATATITILVDVNDNAVSVLTNAASVTSTPNNDPDLTNNSTTEDTTINRLVDVAVTKDAQGAAVAGQDLTFSVTVTNTGPSQARNVEITDLLDSNFTFVTNSLNAGTTGITLAQNGQNLTFDVGLLDANESLTFTYDVTVDAGAVADIDNTATVTTTDTDSDPTNDSDTETVVIGRQVDLAIDKQVDLPTAVPGQDQLVYTITVSHAAGSISDAVDVEVTDILPANVVGVVISGTDVVTQNFDINTNTAVVTLGDLPLGQTRTFTITATVPEDSTGTAENQATVASTGTEIDTSNNSDTATTTLTPDFDVVVTKDVNNPTPVIGGTVIFTVALNNTGPSTATGVDLTDVVPAGLVFVSGTLDGNAGTLSGSDVSFPTITLDSGETQTATLTFTVDGSATGTITNTASIPDLSAAGENDVTNNSDDAVITVSPLVDLGITKTVSDTTAVAGDTLTYTITVDNAGPSTAESVVVTDTLPAGVTFLSGTGPTGQALTATNGVVTIPSGDIASQGSFVITILGTVDAGTAGIQTNSASVTSNTPETNTTNNSATASTTVDPLTSSVAGRVFNDVNDNLIQDPGEEGIAGVVLQLTGTDNFGNAVNLSATTDTAGDYLFAQLAAGIYTLTEIQPAGFNDGSEVAGTGATAAVGDDVFTNLTLGAGATATGFNFGETNELLSKRRFLASARTATETS